MEAQDNQLLPGTNKTFRELRENHAKERNVDTAGSSKDSTSSLNTSVDDPDDMLSDSSLDSEEKKKN